MYTPVLFGRTSSMTYRFVLESMILLLSSLNHMYVGSGSPLALHVKVMLSVCLSYCFWFGSFFMWTFFTWTAMFDKYLRITKNTIRTWHVVRSVLPCLLLSTMYNMRVTCDWHMQTPYDGTHDNLLRNWKLTTRKLKSSCLLSNFVEVVQLYQCRKNRDMK